MKRTKRSTVRTKFAVHFHMLPDFMVFKENMLKNNEDMFKLLAV